MWWQHNFIYKHLKDSTKNLLEFINKFSKIAGYSINMQKSVVFLDSNKELPEKEIRESLKARKAVFTVSMCFINFVPIL